MEAVTGLTPTTFKNLQTDAGIIVRNYPVDTIKTLDALNTYLTTIRESREGLMGATRGGGSFTAEPSIRTIELDGLKAPIKESTVNDMWTPKLSGTLVEITPGNIKDMLMSADIITAPESPELTEIRVRTDIKSEDYIENVAWIGKLKDGRRAVIVLENALNNTGLNFTFVDKGEGTFSFEFHGHAGNLDDLDKGYAPFRIFIVAPPVAPAGGGGG